jgi:biopolymer transport protein ExbD
VSTPIGSGGDDKTKVDPRPAGAAAAPSAPRPKKRKHKIRKHARSLVGAGAIRSDINVTPLVDVVLVLLIIFMVVTPMLHRGVPIELPVTAHHEKKQDTGEQLIVSIRGDGTYIEADRLEGEQLAARLRQELKTTSRPVHIRADRSLTYGDVRKVLDTVHAAGATSVSLATDEGKKE